MTVTHRVAISPNAVARQVGDETVILHLSSGTYFGLDAVGARFWQLMEEGRNLGQICNVLVEEYDVSREKLEHDIMRLVEDLSAKELITNLE